MTELADRVERASGPSYALDCEIWDAIYPGERDERFRKLCAEGPYKGRLGPADRDGYIKPLRSFTASLDAAMTLVPEGVDGSPMNASAGRVNGGNGIVRGLASVSDSLCGPAFTGLAATPALALVAAALRSRSASTEEKA